jgi:hypothetical protein
MWFTWYSHTDCYDAIAEIKLFLLHAPQLVLLAVEATGLASNINGHRRVRQVGACVSEHVHTLSC